MHNIDAAFEVGIRPHQPHGQRGGGIGFKRMHRQLGQVQPPGGRQRRQAQRAVVHQAPGIGPAAGNAARYLQRRWLGLGGQRRVVAQLHVHIIQAQRHFAGGRFILELQLGALDGDARQLHIPGFTGLGVGWLGGGRTILLGLGGLGGGQPVLEHHAAAFVARYAQRGLQQLDRRHLHLLLRGIQFGVFDDQFVQLQQMVLARQAHGGAVRCGAVGFAVALQRHVGHGHLRQLDLHRLAQPRQMHLAVDGAAQARLDHACQVRGAQLQRQRGGGHVHVGGLVGGLAAEHNASGRRHTLVARQG